MRRTFLLLIIFIFILSFNIVVATDLNNTDLQVDDSNLQSEVIDDINLSYTEDIQLNSTGEDEIAIDENVSDDTLQSNNDEPILNASKSKASQKIKTYIAIGATKIKTVDTLKLSVKDVNGKLLKNKKLVVGIHSKRYYVTTNSKGIATIDVNLPSKTYKLTVSFAGDDKYKPAYRAYSVTAYKIKTKISSFRNVIIKNRHLTAFLTTNHNQVIAGKKIVLRIFGKNYYRVSNKGGKISLKIGYTPSNYNLLLKFYGDRFYKPGMKKVNFYSFDKNTLELGNKKLITKGYLRIYLKEMPVKYLSDKDIQIKIGKKVYNKKTDQEGVIVLKPNLKAGTHEINLKFSDYSISRKINCYDGDVKHPTKEIVDMVNGVPDVDVMPGNFIMANNNGVYTLAQWQYEPVMKRDSFCLYLYKKLTRYTFFASKSNPTYFHIIQREKWNVIEKEVNRQLVDANEHGYWPSEVTVDLRGKWYTYPYVRDPQDTEYTCGPTSCSMCSQALRNYYCESHLAALSGTGSEGTGTPGMVYAMECHEFWCTYYYRSTLDHALYELGQGGCALVFHTRDHYISILDISDDGNDVLVSNSYGEWYDIPTGWISVDYLRTRYYKSYDDALIVYLSYHISDYTGYQLNSYYHSMGSGWAVHNTDENIW